MAFAAAASFLLLSGCEPETNSLTGTYPGPNTSFLITVSVHPEIAKDFDHRRVTVRKQDGGNIGNTSRVNTLDGVRYRLTLPSSNLGQPAEFIVELQRKNSSLDNVSILQASPASLGLLKARYYVIYQTIPATFQNMTLAVNNAADLKLGYSPGGLSLNDITGAPIVYFFHFGNSDIAANLTGYNFEVVGGAATDGRFVAAPDDTNDMLDAEGIYGVTGKDMDWAVVMKPGKYDELAQPFTVYFFMKQPKDEKTCPCGVTCGCAVCPYYFMAEKERAYTFAQRSIDLPFDIENGDTISQALLNTGELIDCADLPDPLQ
jgi:hypothetical protein